MDRFFKAYTREIGSPDPKLRRTLVLTVIVEPDTENDPVPPDRVFEGPYLDILDLSGINRKPKIQTSGVSHMALLNDFDEL